MDLTSKARGTAVASAAGRCISELLENRLLLSATPTKTSATATPVSPLLFVENDGQWADSSVRYALRTGHANVLMTDMGPVFEAFNSVDGKTAAEEFSVGFDGANTTVPTGFDASSAKFNFFVGDKSTWRSNVKGYEEVLYKNLYDGVDLYTRGKNDSLKYEFHVAAGADASQVKVSYANIQGLSIDAQGRLHVKTPLGTLIDDAPVVYQTINGKRVSVASSFKLLDANTYTFTLGNYDKTQQLIIDPNVNFGSLLGGDGNDSGRGVAVDGAGNSYVTGTTASTNFPAIGAGADLIFGISGADVGNTSDAFLAKYDNAGVLVFTTFIGGSTSDNGLGVAVDPTGNAYVVGTTTSVDFPATTGLDTVLSGNSDAFVAKFTSAGAQTFATYLGGDNDDTAFSVAADATGAYVAGQTFSNDFPNTGAAHSAVNGEAFFTKIGTTGTRGFSHLVGGGGSDAFYGIAVHGTKVVAVGQTSSVNIGANGFDTTYSGGTDGLIAVFNTTGTLLQSGYLGGSDRDVARAVAFDADGNAWITGDTNSNDFSTLSGFDNTLNNDDTTTSSDAFVAEITTSNTIAFASYLGGTNSDVGYGIAVGRNGEIFVVGSTASTDFPTTNGTVKVNGGGSTDGFVVTLVSNNIGTANYVGGSRDDIVYAVSADPVAGASITGSTSSPNFKIPGVSGTFSANATDAFFAHIEPAGVSQVPIAPSNLVARAVSLTAIDIFFVDNSDNEQGFTLYRRTGTTGSFVAIATLDPNTTTYKDTGLQPDTTYYYRVSAFNLQGNSGFSNTASATTFTAVVKTPTGLRAVAVSNNRIDLSFTDNSNNETGFEVYRALASIGTFTRITTLGANVTTYSDPGLSPSTTYEYEVRGVNAFRNGTFTDIATATTKAADYLVPPTSLIATRSTGGNVNLRFQDNSNNETGFGIERTVGGSNDFTQIDTTAANANSYVDQFADPAVVYVYRVRAMNATNTSAYSNVAPSDLSKALATPVNLQARALSSSKIEVQFNEKAITETGYIVERRRNNAGWQVLRTLPKNSTKFTDSALSANTTYSYRVRATDGFNFSAFSNIATDTTLGTLETAPKTPSGLTAKAITASSIRLSFNDNSSEDTSFTIERSTSRTGTFVTIDSIPSSKSTYTDTHLKNSTRYYYRVRAHTTNARSSASEVAAATTLAYTKVSIRATDNAGSESGSDPLLFTISRKGDTSSAIVVRFKVTGEAQGNDFKSFKHLVTIGAGKSSATVQLTPVDDTKVEGTENVKLSLIKSDAYSISPSLASAIGHVHDNDIATPTDTTTQSLKTSAFSSKTISDKDLVLG